MFAVENNINLPRHAGNHPRKKWLFLLRKVRFIETSKSPVVFFFAIYSLLLRLNAFMLDCVREFRIICFRVKHEKYYQAKHGRVLIPSLITYHVPINIRF